jgi:hypothetical protein
MPHIKINPSSLMTRILWVSMILAMFSSMHHVADQFGALEKPGSEGFGWCAAVAIDASILALTYGLRARRKANRDKGTKILFFRLNGSSVRLWFGVLFLTGISIAANYLAARSVKPDETFQAIAFAATLPIIVILLSDIASADDEKAAKRQEATEERDSTVSELRRQLSDSAARVLTLTAQVSDMTAQVSELRRQLSDSESQVTVSGIQLSDSESQGPASVMTKTASVMTKEDFFTIMRTGNGNRPAGVSDIMEQFRVRERTAYRWWSEWQKLSDAETVGEVALTSAYCQMSDRITPR